MADLKIIRHTKRNKEKLKKERRRRNPIKMLIVAYLFIMAMIAFFGN